jgi:hypothetical protein
MTSRVFFQTIDGIADRGYKLFITALVIVLSELNTVKNFPLHSLWLLLSPRQVQGEKIYHLSTLQCRHSIIRCDIRESFEWFQRITKHISPLVPQWAETPDNTRLRDTGHPCRLDQDVTEVRSCSVGSRSGVNDAWVLSQSPITGTPIFGLVISSPISLARFSKSFR